MNRVTQLKDSIEKQVIKVLQEGKAKVAQDVADGVGHELYRAMEERARERLEAPHPALHQQQVAPQLAQHRRRNLEPNLDLLTAAVQKGFEHAGP